MLQTDRREDTRLILQVLPTLSNSLFLLHVYMNTLLTLLIVITMMFPLSSSPCSHPSKNSGGEYMVDGMSQPSSPFVSIDRLNSPRRHWTASWTTHRQPTTFFSTFIANDLIPVVSWIQSERHWRSQRWTEAPWRSSRTAMQARWERTTLDETKSSWAATATVSSATAATATVSYRSLQQLVLRNLWGVLCNSQTVTVVLVRVSLLSLVDVMCCCGWNIFRWKKW